MSNTVTFQKEIIDLEIKYNKKAYRFWILWFFLNFGLLLYNTFNIYKGSGTPWIAGYGIGVHFTIILFSISEIILSMAEKKELTRRKSHLEEHELREREIYLGQMNSLQNTSAFPY